MHQDKRASIGVDQPTLLVASNQSFFSHFSHCCFRCSSCFRCVCDCDCVYVCFGCCVRWLSEYTFVYGLLDQITGKQEVLLYLDFILVG